MAAPVVADVVDFLVNRCGVDSGSPIVTDLDSLGKALDSAIAQLSVVTGYDPFIADAASDGYVEIVGGRGLFWNGANGAVEISLDGTVYTEGTDYRLYPLNKSRKEWVKWLSGLSPGKPLTVNAEWGFGDDCPDDLWQAIVMFAAGYALASYALGQAGYLGESWTDGDVAEKMAVASRITTESGIASVIPGTLVSEAKLVYRTHARSVIWGN